MLLFAILVPFGVFYNSDWRTKNCGLRAALLFQGFALYYDFPIRQACIQVWELNRVFTLRALCSYFTGKSGYPMHHN